MTLMHGIRQDEANDAGCDVHILIIPGVRNLITSGLSLRTMVHI